MKRKRRKWKKQKRKFEAQYAAAERVADRLAAEQIQEPVDAEQVHVEQVHAEQFAEEQVHVEQETKMQARVHIRWMIRRDMTEVVAIESSSSDCPWCEDDFLMVLRQRNCIGMVAELGELVVGFMLYELHKYKLQILNFAVHPDFRRQGVGHQLMQKLVGKLSPGYRIRLVTHVRETNLGGQLFLKDQGWLGIQVLREYYPDSEEDAFLMLYTLDESQPANEA